jgi:hypothetical protein
MNVNTAKFLYSDIEKFGNRVQYFGNPNNLALEESSLGNRSFAFY